MADLKNVMGVSTDDIKSIMGVATDSIKSVVGLDYPLGVEGWFGSRHFQVSGYDSSANSLDYITYKSSTSDGNTSEFADLTTDRQGVAGAGTGVGKGRGVAGGSYNTVGAGGYIRSIDYWATASAGVTALDFGDLVAPNGNGEGGGSSNGTLLFFMGGNDGMISPYVTDRMEYVTISSTGNGTDAGNLIDEIYESGVVSGDTRGAVMGGITRDSGDGYIRYAYDDVDYIVFHTSNNAADFGELSVGSYHGAGCASPTRWVFKSGHRYTSSEGNVHHIHMDYWTAASLGNASDFGDVSNRTQYLSGMADGTRGEWWGGKDADAGSLQGNSVDSIAYITIASAGDGTDAGNLHFGTSMVFGENGLSGAAS